MIKKLIITYILISIPIVVYVGMYRLVIARIVALIVTVIVLVMLLIVFIRSEDTAAVIVILVLPAKLLLRVPRVSVHAKDVLGDNMITGLLV